MVSKHLSDAELSAAGIGIRHHFGGKAYVKETYIKEGKSLTQHAHDFDHLAFLVFGEVVVQVGDSAHMVEGPRGFLIPKGEEHGVTAITDAMWLCIWGTECTDAALVDDAVSKGE